MKKLISLALVVAALAVAAPAHAGTGPMAEWRWRRCRFQTLDHRYWTVQEVHFTVHCALDHFPTSHATADYVAERESHFLWFARNPSSGTCGVYQHMPSLWGGRLAAFDHARPKWNLAHSDRNGGGGCFDARSNVLVSIRMAHVGGWAPWGM